MTKDVLLSEQNTLLRALLRLVIDERMEESGEKARFLAQFDFTHRQIAEILNRNRSTITRHIAEDS